MTAVCPFCGNHVTVARQPWLFTRHTVHGHTHPSGAGTICPGSRSIYTLALLGLRELEPEHIPPLRGAA